MKLHSYTKSSDRAAFLEKELSISLNHIRECGLDNEGKAHCENKIGSIALPLGVAGPLSIQGDGIQGQYYVPLATTEGALVASVSRGAKATAIQGILTSVQKVGVTRGPVLKANTKGGALKIKQWVISHAEELGVQAAATSSHIKYIGQTIKVAGLYVYIRFSFDTDKAMGMNMATIASQKMIEYIAEQTDSQVVAVAGNFDCDKKPAWINSILGRGYSVQAEAIISPEIVQSTLKTHPIKIAEVWKSKCLIGSALAGSMGFNAHHANIVAAFYAATGQDLAHVVEGSLGITIMDVMENGSLYISVNLPSVMLGTIGGGMKLSTQSEARSIMKSESPEALAEILGAAVLAGELSLLASLSEGTLATSHKKLGR